MNLTLCHTLGVLFCTKALVDLLTFLASSTDTSHRFQAMSFDAIGASAVFLVVTGGGNGGIIVKQWVIVVSVHQESTLENSLLVELVTS